MREQGKGCRNGEGGGRFFGASRVCDEPNEGMERPRKAWEGPRGAGRTLRELLGEPMRKQGGTIQGLGLLSPSPVQPPMTFSLLFAIT